MKALVTGGVRSGKSRHAESLIGDRPATYVAPGPTTAEDPDPDWVARLTAHRARRPKSWTTVESRDLATALATPGPVILDCLGTWLTGVLDERALWEAPSAQVTASISGLVGEAATILRSHHDDVVLVTNEVGLGVVPEHRSGRLFRDLLGLVNQELATACDEVHLVLAGRILVL